ncbi:hypothetical protein JQ544_01025 [Bradyrhizobium diazoefficiens]|nr:hypothetical protein [Bradyrhizobium diazoefficiens]MBR0810088.1 hypothetical protein [Bradyrhizobium diazoefficiens]
MRFLGVFGLVDGARWDGGLSDGRGQGWVLCVIARPSEGAANDGLFVLKIKK